MKSLALPIAGALMLLLAPKAHAQFGVKAGLNFAELQGRSGENASYKTFYHVGVLYQKRLLGPVAIQYELQYSEQGGRLKGSVTNYEDKLHYFTVPVLAKVTIGPIFAEAGPQFGYLVSARKNGNVQIATTNGSASYGQVDQSATDDFKRGDFSVAAGLGVKFSMLSVGGRFVGGVNDINDLKNLSGINDPRLKNRVFQLYAAIQLGK